MTVSLFQMFQHTHAILNNTVACGSVLFSMSHLTFIADSMSHLTFIADNTSILISCKRTMILAYEYQQSVLFHLSKLVWWQLWLILS